MRSVFGHDFFQMFTSPHLSSYRLLLLFVPGVLMAHPEPDIPVRAYFQEDGDLRVTVELDTRVFADDPEMTQYLYFKDFLTLPETEREAFKRQAEAYLKPRVELIFEPGGKVEPEFEFDFTTWNGQPLVGAYDYVMVTGTWRTQVPPGSTGYKISASNANTLSVVFLNFYEGRKLERSAVLFPGESSFVQDLAKLAEAGVSQDSGEISGGAWKVFASFVRAGFVYFLPNGLVHGAFLLALLFLSRTWRLRWRQIAVFALVLALGAVFVGPGLAKALSGVVLGPILAIGVIVMAADTLFCPKWSPWRLYLVGVLGLAHGVGLGAMLGDLRQMGGQLFLSQAGYLTGILGGILAIVIPVHAATFWLSDAAFRNFIGLPGSILLIVAGLLFLTGIL